MSVVILVANRNHKTLSRLPLALLTLLIATLGSTFPSGAKDGAASVSEAYEARGLIRASSRIEYRNEIVAPVRAANFLAGQSFREGDTLIEFDCSRYEAEQKAARALANAASIEYATQKRLLKYQAAGKNDVALAASKSAEAHAQLEMQKVRNRSCVFKAPFAGRVVELNAEAHEFPPSDRPLIVIINDTRLELELVVPSRWLRWLKPEMPLTIMVDETGEQGSGVIDRIAAEIDPVSQTVKVIAAFTRKPVSVLAGMSGTVSFQPKTN